MKCLLVLRAAAGEFAERATRTTMSTIPTGEHTRGAAIFVRLAVHLSACALLTGGATYGEGDGGLRRFLERRCYECHDGDSGKGDLDLEALALDFSDGGRAGLWTRVYDRVVRGEMPPENAEQPTEEERASNAALLAGLLTAADLEGGEVVLRRLNRVEYENTVRDLFGVEVFVRALLPEDGTSHGFDTVGETLSISTEQMQSYLDAADVVLDAVFGAEEAPKRVKVTINLRDLIDEEGRKTVRVTEDGVVLFNSGYNPSVLRSFDNPGPGRYRVRVRASAVQSDRPVTMLVYGGVWGLRDKHVAGFFDVPPGGVTTVEFVDRLWEAGDTFEIYPFGTVHGQNDPEGYGGPGLFVGDVEIEGPLGEWPPAGRAAFEGETLADAARILGAFLPRAWRRPVGEGEVAPVLELVEGALAAGKPFEKAMRVGLKGVLCSPEFLFLEEPGEGRLEDFALASRLAYFLWSSMPDGELLAVAGGGRLGDPGVLRAQVERMLGDEKAGRFTENFTGQWLGLRAIDFTLPDEKLYPDYDELLKRSMVAESERFFQELLERDLSLVNFIDSDFVFVNERLATHYGIEGVTGQGLRKVELPADSVRGGVLTQASVLKVTANGTTTSPVLRGVWVLENLLGRPAPPPPPGVPAIEPDIRGATTIREQLEKHRDVESCARCHREIDPPGFALESFDVIGGWRDYYRTKGGGGWVEGDPRYPYRYIGYRKGPGVDPSGRTVGGQEFFDVRDYKRLLLEEKREVARCLTEKLLVYATGRGLGFADRAGVAAIVAEVEAKSYGLRSLVHEVVQSEAFRSP